LYRQRNCIERVIGHLKINRAIATRYDQLADSFLGMLATARYRSATPGMPFVLERRQSTSSSNLASDKRSGFKLQAARFPAVEKARWN
jgi:hypothetical protein